MNPTILPHDNRPHHQSLQKGLLVLMTALLVLLEPAVPCSASGKANSRGERVRVHLLNGKSVEGYFTLSRLNVYTSEGRRQFDVGNITSLEFMDPEHDPAPEGD